MLRRLLTCLAFLLISTLPLQAQIELVGEWGEFGLQPGQFHWPRGIALNSRGQVFVVDQANGRIQVFDGSGNFLRLWSPTGAGTLQSPWGIQVGPNGAVFVANTNSSRILKFNAQGTLLKTLKGPNWSMPWDVAMDSKGYLYVTDQMQHAVYKLRPDGRQVAKWGSEGSGPGQFQYPRGIAVDSKDNVYVADTNNGRVQKLNSRGRFLTEWSVQGLPDGIDIDRYNNVYVASFDDGLRKFDPRGNLLDEFLSSNSEESLYLIDVAADGKGNLYVVDTNNFRILKFIDREVSERASAAAPEN